MSYKSLTSLDYWDDDSKAKFFAKKYEHKAIISQRKLGPYDYKSRIYILETEGYIFDNLESVPESQYMYDIEILEETPNDNKWISETYHTQISKLHEIAISKIKKRLGGGCGS